MFHHKQQNGLTKVLDVIGSALIIALALDVAINQPLGWLQAIALGVAGVACVGLSLVLRKVD